jgi:hypothetical protein
LEINNDRKFGIDTMRLEPVTEPATILLLGTGILGIAAFKRKRRKLSMKVIGRRCFDNLQL